MQLILILLRIKMSSFISFAEDLSQTTNVLFVMCTLKDNFSSPTIHVAKTIKSVCGFQLSQFKGSLYTHIILCSPFIVITCDKYCSLFLKPSRT